MTKPKEQPQPLELRGDEREFWMSLYRYALDKTDSTDWIACHRKALEVADRGVEGLRARTKDGGPYR